MYQETDVPVPAPVAPETLTQQELRALAYFAIGVSSEGSVAGRDVSNRLSFAGTIRNGVMDPVGNSGFSLGTLQTDLGAHQDAAEALVQAYQDWVGTHRREWVMTLAEQTQASRDLGRNGRTIEQQNGRAFDPVLKTRLDTFLATDAGITFVHERDRAQVDTLMRAGGGMDQLSRTSLYLTASREDQVRLATVVMKLENQGGAGFYPRIIRGIENGTLATFDDVKARVDGFMPNRNGRLDYLESGADHALEGADVFNRLRGSDPNSPLYAAWRGVLRDPTANPTQLHQAAGGGPTQPHYVTIKNLFLQPDEAGRFIQALDRGAPHSNEARGARGPHPPSVGFYVAGNDFVQWNRAGDGYRHAAGEWTAVDRDELTRASGQGGVIDLFQTRAGVRESILHVDPQSPALRPEHEMGAEHQHLLQGETRGLVQAHAHAEPRRDLVTGDADLDRLAIALLRGSDGDVSRAVAEISRSPEVAVLEAWGRGQQHLGQEQTVALVQAPVYVEARAMER